jgi:ketosteroid isomerase-like protein
VSGSDRTSEARAAYERYLQTNDGALRGEVPWSALADCFTEDAVYVDPARGRIEGRAAIARFLADSMAGLDGWTFPYEWVMVEGDRVVSQWWTRLPGTRADGQPLQAPGMSILRYAGEGRFDYELDIVNMVEIFELTKMSEWRPNDAMRPAPTQPDRNLAPPNA